MIVFFISTYRERDTESCDQFDLVVSDFINISPEQWQIRQSSVHPVLDNSGTFAFLIKPITNN